MPTDLTAADPTPVLAVLNGFRHSQILFTACELGLFDALAGGPKSAAALASAMSLNPDALERLLGGCEMLGLLTRTDAGYANTPAATTYLTTASPNRLLGYVNYSNAVLWKLWDNLPDAVRDGTHQWKRTYGTDGPIFSQLFRTDADRREFLMGMHGYGLISSPQVVNAVDLGQYKTFVDLGGATGHLTVAACRRWANLSGVVFDLPEVVAQAKELIDPTDVANRITVKGGDFFADELPAGDVYALGRILHDWTEAKIVKLLTRIYAALPAGGMVFIAEKVLHEDKAGPEWAVLQSLNMLLVTEGKERTLGEYAGLLEGVGFRAVTCRRTAAPLDVVTAVK